MNPIEQAIEARALRLAEGRLEYEQGTYEWSIAADIMLRECAAALTALREAVKQEPVGDKLADRALAKSFRETPREASLADQAGMRRAISDPLTNRAFNMDGCTTPPPAPVLSDAEIDAITVAQWGDRVVTAAYRAYARAIEQSVIARGVVRGEL